MAYQVSKENGSEIIHDPASGLRVCVSEKSGLDPLTDKAYCLVTEYEIKGGFVPVRIFVFEALVETDLEALKAMADFYFGILLGTELYVKEVPASSSLYEQEAIRLYGEVI